MKWFAVLFISVSLLGHQSDCDALDAVPHFPDLLSVMDLFLGSPDMKDLIDPLYKMERAEAIDAFLKILRDLELNKLITRYRSEKDYQKYIDEIAETEAAKTKLPEARTLDESSVKKIQTYVLGTPERIVQFHLNNHIHKVENYLTYMKNDKGTFVVDLPNE